MQRKLFTRAISVSILSCLMVPSVYAQTLRHKAETPTQNGTVEQTWTAGDIERLQNQSSSNQASSNQESSNQTNLDQPLNTAQSGMDDFNKYFSSSFLNGYTKNDNTGAGYDASMDTYYLDEDNQLVALYDDHQDPGAFYSMPLNPYPLTGWERDINSQISDQPAWVGSVVSATSAALKQKIVQARTEGSHFLVWVNAASFTLRVIDTATEEQILVSKVIVGAPGTQTPLMTTRIQNIKFNPDWSPPPSLRRKGKVYTPPSDHNPLGQARFSTDNRMNIYLHDTNNHDLFDNQIRALSAGCVRVQEWHSLAQILGGLSGDQVDQKTEGNRTNFYDVNDALVWISYDRIDLNAENRVVLFGDVYRKQPLPENNLPRDIQ